MKNNENANSILKAIKSLSEKEQSIIAEQIIEMLSKPTTAKSRIYQDLVSDANNEKPDCPHCGAKANMGWINKRGLDKGVQRYKCKHCGRYFYPTTNTAFARTRKDADTWRKFVRLTISGENLKTCSEECKIAYQTAFTWRHKILNAFVVNQNNTFMSGIVEVDEMLLPISYKGNHVKGDFGVRRLMSPEDNGLPRKSYKRGSDNTSIYQSNKACVFCMVEDGNKNYFASVPGTGFMNVPMLDKTVGKHINKESALMLADNYRPTRNYFKIKGYKYKILASGSANGHKPEVKDGLHIQHVNNMHHHIRRFLARYCGVSTKYLENYIAMFVWLKSINKVNKLTKTEKATITRIAMHDCYISRKELENRPAIPMCA